MKHKFEKFLPIAKAVAGLSKDPSTKVGAIALNDDGIVLAVGYNGFPRGTNDDRTLYDNRPAKLARVAHAEQNVVAQAAYAGHALKGSTLVLSGLYPCSSCAKSLIQAGVRRIITPPSLPSSSWYADAEVSKQLFAEAQVEIIEVSHESNDRQP